MKASFTQVEWLGTKLTFRALVGDIDEVVWVKLPDHANQPNDDLIATFFATLAGQGLHELRMDLNPSHSVKEQIERFCGCALTSSGTGPESDLNETTGHSGHALSFSGGFDSLAALSLLGDGVQLISMDFGGWFERESKFFQQFSPHTVASNFRMVGLGRRHWLFMLSGVILLRDFLGVKRFSTGAIMESSPWNLHRNIDGMPPTNPLLQAVGLEQVNPAQPLTEVATAQLAMQFFPGQVLDSLDSLAAPMSGKRLRKQMLVRSLWDECGPQGAEPPRINHPKQPPLIYGESFADDLLLPYLIKLYGEVESSALVSNIPPALFAFARASRLTFYRRYHPGFYANMERSMRERFTGTLSRSDILPYTERDWHELRQLVDVLREHHSGLHA